MAGRMCRQREGIGVTPKVTRAQVLAFRLRRHHLSRRLSEARMADAVRACSIRNSPPGSAVLALLARTGGAGVADARQCFADLADELGEVRWDGGTGLVLRTDAADLQRAELPAGVRLLPPNDPYLLARDRETLVADQGLRKLILPASGSPGAVVADGEVAAIWRSQKKGTTMRVQVSAPRRLAKSAIGLVEKEAELLALSRACYSAEVTFDLMA